MNALQKLTYLRVKQFGTKEKGVLSQGIFICKHGKYKKLTTIFSIVMATYNVVADTQLGRP
jgi:hypothetical protein